MIKGVHTMFYSSDAAGLRIFLREMLDLKATDVGNGWLIFDLPEADMGCHPSDPTGQQGRHSGTTDICFYCDDLQKTVDSLKAKGVEFKGEIEDQGYGLVTFFKVPGDFYIQLYQPLYNK
ncbi:MAG: VOC family protein [Chitinophagaceae bacterium]|nr:VOC family protein [Chitinophagaceae bacterium]